MVCARWSGAWRTADDARVESRWRKGGRLTVLGPLVLATDLVLFFGGEVILDVERLADLVGRLALDHVGDRLATNVQESFDVQVVGGLDRARSVSQPVSRRHPRGERGKSMR